MKYFLFLGIWLTAIGFASCQSQNHDTLSYQLDGAIRYHMPPELEEISGITFLEGNANTVYAIQDEEGLLFEYDLIKKQVVSTTSFAKKGDYEEIATDGKYFYVLKSNGDIYSFPVGHRPAPGEVTVNKGLVPKAEYEAMAFEPSSGSLFLLCKVCKTDKKGGAVTGYILQVDEAGQLSNTGEFSLQISALSALDKKIKHTFRPSSMARRAGSAEWYILSSIDQALVITDDAFNPKEVIRLARKDFEQPEGIAFDQDGKLYISSEAGGRKHAIIYKFDSIK